MDCEHCIYYMYDEEYEDYVCTVNMDEDDFAALTADKHRECPYYRDNDEYKTAGKQ